MTVILIEECAAAPYSSLQKRLSVCEIFRGPLLDVAGGV